MIFNKGFLFYAFFNLRLFLFLITRKKIDILVANDLDTLPANYLVSLIRRTNLVYDSHEYFTEIPELIDRKFVRNFWLRIEKLIVPNLKYAYTVSSSIADEYFKKYGIKFQVIRNLPVGNKNMSKIPLPFHPGTKKVLIYQGSLNIGRGLELLIESIKDIEQVVFLIAGDGDIRAKLENYVKVNNLSDKVYFLGKISFEKLQSITIQADGGVSFEEDTGLNYRFSLPNKLFDYIQAQIPVFVSSLPEMSYIVERYNIGVIGYKRDIEEVKKNIIELLFNDEKRMIWKQNLNKAALDLSWENEEKYLFGIFSDLI
jgi:glycosyltransferase involved in cell wall biosynthesis